MTQTTITDALTTFTLKHPEAKILATRGAGLRVGGPPHLIPRLCGELADYATCLIAGVIAEDDGEGYQLIYLMYSPLEHEIVSVETEQPRGEPAFHSVSPQVHAVDWHEREIEDSFEITFHDHPRLGDFVLHDDLWDEGIAPMRKDFDEKSAQRVSGPRRTWKPRRVLDSSGAVIFSVGPIFSGTTSPVNFLIESLGEEVMRSYPRLFYIHRGIEKRLEGMTVEDGLLLVERFAQTSSVAHAVAYCMAIERIRAIAVPRRETYLRGVFLEMERVRNHTTVLSEIIEKVCWSRAQVKVLVPACASQA